MTPRTIIFKCGKCNTVRADPSPESKSWVDLANEKEKSVVHVRCLKCDDPKEKDFSALYQTTVPTGYLYVVEGTYI